MSDRLTSDRLVSDRLLICLGRSRSLNLVAREVTLSDDISEIRDTFLLEETNSLSVAVNTCDFSRTDAPKAHQRRRVQA
ncbi:hypothetical protein OROGR_015450 [Orobanche gracilis]